MSVRSVRTHRVVFRVSTVLYIGYFGGAGLVGAFHI